MQSSRLRFLVALLAGAFATLSAASTRAQERFEFYPRATHVSYEMGLFAKFESHIIITPSIHVRDGIVVVDIHIQRKDLVHKPPGGLARVEWELTVSDCGSSSAFREIKLHLTNRSVTVHNGGQVQLRRGEGVRGLDIHYLWAKNDRRLQFRGGRLVGIDASDEIPKPVRAVLGGVIQSPEEYAQELITEADKLDARAKKFLEAGKKQLAAVTKYKNAAKKAGSRDEADRLLRMAQKFQRAALKNLSEAQRLITQSTALRSEAEDIKISAGLDGADAKATSGAKDKS